MTSQTKDRVPGRARRELRTSPAREVYPDYEPVPCATFEDAFAAISSGEAELGMIPIENSVAGRVADIHHLMPDSGLHIVAEHFLPVRHQLLAPQGRDARRHQDGREPRPRARPVPQDHPQARHQAGGRRRHRGLRARGRRSRRQDARRHRVAARRRDLRARHPGRGHRGRGPQHHALHRAVARGASGPRAATARSSRPSCSGCATCRPRSTRRSAASPPTAST